MKVNDELQKQRSVEGQSVQSQRLPWGVRTHIASISQDIQSSG